MVRHANAQCKPGYIFQFEEENPLDRGLSPHSPRLKNLKNPLAILRCSVRESAKSPCAQSLVIVLPAPISTSEALPSGATSWPITSDKDIFANTGFVLCHAIIVAGNHPRAHIAPLPYLTIPQIAQMPRFHTI